MDVSFISATLVLPAVIGAAFPASPDDHQGRQIVVLVKPQFEAGREHVGKGGIVRDEAAQLAAVEKVRTALQSLGAVQTDVINRPSSAPKAIASSCYTADSSPGRHSSRRTRSRTKGSHATRPLSPLWLNPRDFCTISLCPMASPQISSHENRSVISRPDRPESRRFFPGFSPGSASTATKSSSIQRRRDTFLARKLCPGRTWRRRRWILSSCSVAMEPCFPRRESRRQSTCRCWALTWGRWDF